MADKIKTKTVSKNMAKASPIILNETSTTVLFFEPECCDKGVRGNLVRYKKAKGELQKIDEVDFKRLKLNEGVHIELSTDSLQKLVQHTEQVSSILEKEGIKFGKNEYIVAPVEEALIITDKNKQAIFKKLLDANLPHEFWKSIQNEMPELADKIAAGHLLLHRKNVLNELCERLKSSYSETSGSDSWQVWIYDNSWLFGANYNKPIQKVKINLNGIMPDYIFPTVDGFIDVLEIKLPEVEVLVEDSSHKGSWYWSAEANKAIGQTINYLATIELNALQIERYLDRERNIKISTIKPRGYILIGDSSSWTVEKKEALRKLNSHLHHIEVLTYQDLKNRGNAFISSSAS